MTEIVSSVILPTTIWFSVSHLADWLMTKSGCSLAARTFSRRASLCLKFICFTLKRTGVPFRGMTHKSSLRRAHRAALLLPSFSRSFERTLTTRITSLSRHQDPEQARVVTDISRDPATVSQSVERKKWRGAKRYMHSWSFWRKRDRVFLFFFSVDISWYRRYAISDLAIQF